MENIAKYFTSKLFDSTGSKPMYTLQHGSAVTDQFKQLGIESRRQMMQVFDSEAALNTVLETARSEHSAHNLRKYIHIFETYHVTFQMRQKRHLLQFLFDRLNYPEEDIRENCARLMGEVIGKCDQDRGCNQDTKDLFLDYFKAFVELDVTISARHRAWIGHALGSFVRAVFQNASEKAIPVLCEILLDHYHQYIDDESLRNYLLKVMRFLPIHRLKVSDQFNALTMIYQIALKSQGKLRLEGLEALHILLPQVGPEVSDRFKCDGLFEGILGEWISVYAAMARRMRRYLVNPEEALFHLIVEDSSLIYLSNLKTATPAVVKRLQIDMLLELIWQQRVDPFHVAMHFSNLLKVSAYQDVREKAGVALLEVFVLIPHEQRNDIVIELLRALEIEGYQFTKYIPKYLGVLINTLEESEHLEIIQDLSFKIKTANPQIALLILSTATSALSDYLLKVQSIDYHVKALMAVLLNGLVHYVPSISSEAFYQIVSIFLEQSLGLAIRTDLYTYYAKKILSIVTTHQVTETLNFMGNATAFDYLYRFIEVAQEGNLPLEIDYPKRVAFFPGSFDPFSIAHKASACAIRNMGFEVYLAVDEFSWSKRTQPNMVRRDIIKMSIADEMHIYVLPRRLIVNIANAEDLLHLKAVFDERPVYLVVGSDVLTHASAYQLEPARSVLLATNHIVFDRAEGMGNVKDTEKLNQVLGDMSADVIRMTLDKSIENISSTQIRNFVDQSRDISELTDPLVQKFIYAKNLYRREPQFKDTMTVQALSVEVHEHLSEALGDQIQAQFAINKEHLAQKLSMKQYRESTRVLVIRSLEDETVIEAFSLFHWLRSGDIFTEFNSQHIAEYIRENATGRILVLDALVCKKDSRLHHIEQSILTETLAFCLSKDYSYAVYHNVFQLDDLKQQEILNLSGFIKIGMLDQPIYAVNMTAPITLNYDIKSAIKAPFRNHPILERAIVASRIRLAKILCDFYPGHLVLAFDRTLIYDHLIRIVCEENQVPTRQVTPRTLGKAMLVPYGDVFKRWIIPNTVTKSLHTERYYNRYASHYKVQAFPNYLDLEIQAMTIKSFNRPVILVDDLFDKGHRFKAIKGHFERNNIPIRTLAVAILSGRGKSWLQMEGIPVKAAYYIPRIRLWFNEGQLYPILGGDAIDPSVWKDSAQFSLQTQTIGIPSINKILPYVYPEYIKRVKPEQIAKFSMICLENTVQILQALEEVYLNLNGRNLTVNALSDVLLSPRFPEKQAETSPMTNLRPSEIIRSDQDHLTRIAAFYSEDKDEL